MNCLDYPFDGEEIIKKKRQIKRELLEDDSRNYIDIRIAILGGSTTNNVKLMLELFLLNQGIRPQFYESEYNKYYEDAVFGNETLNKFSPDVIYIHTTQKNILQYPDITDNQEQINVMLQKEYDRYQEVWDSLYERYHCIIIQNNFEFPLSRYMGNKACSCPQGNINFINHLNEKFAIYAQQHSFFYINDINYLSAACGLQRWHDPTDWYMYKYAMSTKVIPELGYSIARIIKSIYGKNKKVLVVDLDNTIWGGVLSEDGINGIKIGKETGVGQLYLEIQKYIKRLSDQGIILAINSKNDEQIALEGLEHPENVLSREDFAVIKANWLSKDRNIIDIAKELNVLPESLVFMDDNPAERQIVKLQVPECSVPQLNCPEAFTELIESNGFFEMTGFSTDDINRNNMYKNDIKRSREKAAFVNYEDYLKSLKMRAVIGSFEPIYYERIAQLTNKSNQFNLTTRRYTVNDIEQIAQDLNHITWYGRLEDKFGDNGLVSVVIGEKKENILYLVLWLMSCRVLKRDMEFAMLDSVVQECEEQGITKIRGMYIPTSKNHMVEKLYEQFGFQLEKVESDGTSIWLLELKNYKKRNKVIDVLRGEAYDRK